MEIGKKKVHVVWNDPIKRDFFLQKASNRYCSQKYRLPLVLFLALRLVFITFVGKRENTDKS